MLRSSTTHMLQRPLLLLHLVRLPSRFFSYIFVYHLFDKDTNLRYTIFKNSIVMRLVCHCHARHWMNCCKSCSMQCCRSANVRENEQIKLLYVTLVAESRLH